MPAFSFINVLDYSGVDPTGATDSTTGIQNAMNNPAAELRGIKKDHAQKNNTQ